MKLYLQWAKASPGDWVEIDVSRVQAIRSLPKRNVPTASSVVDNSPGWLNALNCQGIVFQGFDHIAIEFLSATELRITGWQDDDEDFGDTRWATQWTLSDPAPDPALGGAVNTVQTRVVWATPDAAEWFAGTDVRPWSEFSPPATNITFHGIWMPDELYTQHVTTRSQHGWREWIR